MGEFDNYSEEEGISHEVTTSYSPKQNEEAKRVKLTIIGSTRAILAQ